MVAVMVVVADGVLSETSRTTAATADRRVVGRG